MGSDIGHDRGDDKDSEQSNKHPDHRSSVVDVSPENDGNFKLE